MAWSVRGFFFVFFQLSSGGWVKSHIHSFITSYHKDDFFFLAALKHEASLSSHTSTYQIHFVFRFHPRSRCNSSSRCCCRAREHVDPTWSRKIRHWSVRSTNAAVGLLGQGRPWSVRRSIHAQLQQPAGASSRRPTALLRQTRNSLGPTRRVNNPQLAIETPQRPSTPNTANTFGLGTHQAPLPHVWFIII